MKINAILLGKLIKEARIAENMSSAEFASKAGIAPSSLTRLENPPKIDFRVSYDTLLNGLELVGSFDCIRERKLRFDEYVGEAYAKETINLFLTFADKEDYLNSYIYGVDEAKSGYVYRHMADMRDSLQDVLNNHFKVKEFQQLLINSREGFMEKRLAGYKDDLEAYQDNKLDLPNRFIVTEAITDNKTMGEGYGMRCDIDDAFQKLLDSPSVANAVMLAVAMIGNV